MGESRRHLIARLAVAMMAADGRVTPAEVDALRRIEELGVGPIARLAAEELERAAREPIDVQAAVEGLGEVGADAATLLLGAIADIAAADRVVSPRELEVFDLLAASLRVAPGDARDILSAAACARPASAEEPPPRPQAHHEPARAVAPPPAEPARVEEACQRLGFDALPSRDVLDSAYLRLVDHYAPARVADLGVEFVTLAVRRLAGLTNAYETVLHAIREGHRTAPAGE